MAETSEPALRIGLLRERAPGERRVAVVPGAVPDLRALGAVPLVETGAGAAAWYTDEDYTAAGGEILTPPELHERAHVLLSVTRPSSEVLRRLRPGQTVIGMLQPASDPLLVRDLADLGVTAISLDGVPRTLSRAQSMDALSSQANVAGYKAVLVAAAAYDRYLPLLMTAAGVARPAEILVLGAGVAGLQAIATAGRLGAVVTGYDVREEAREEIRSLGARVLELPEVESATADQGYARALTGSERRSQRAVLADQAHRFDIVIATAQVPGGRPPLLLEEDAVARLRPGAVVVDLAAGPLGGNVELSRPDETVVTDRGVTVIGAGNLPATVPRAASEAYSRNIKTLLGHMLHEGRLTIDLDDQIQAGVVVTHDGRVVHPAAAEAVEAMATTGGVEPHESGTPH
ncbi:NAD(P) transhydrogenase subunit alpha [Lipingzhangella halophila]|uniref:proton-translocating NAD(P)(+) transhydrogenase n=1 Tax=Lipingzhangella halophila TaxID=1783352 RepID=A0A7W7RJI0_9ACTN|nr:NAD(P) transhydrogenase subunit alpha [Lipingzhangella halophila]MBB4932606.1 NAD(P) transhydrogenase subunit alpha [Lipingzhangella halophila]